MGFRDFQEPIKQKDFICFYDVVCLEEALAWQPDKLVDAPEHADIQEQHVHPPEHPVHQRARESSPDIGQPDLKNT